MTGPPPPAASNMSSLRMARAPTLRRRPAIYELIPASTRLSFHAWDQSMPYAMFFNWEKHGDQTGLAIHAAVGDDIAKLGSRASAGCVHLSPDNARLLYHLIRSDYEARCRASPMIAATHTMSNQGALMRDAARQAGDGRRLQGAYRHRGFQRRECASPRWTEQSRLRKIGLSLVPRTGDQLQNQNDGQRNNDGPGRSERLLRLLLSLANDIYRQCTFPAAIRRAPSPRHWTR